MVPLGGRGALRAVGFQVERLHAHGDALRDGDVDRGIVGRGAARERLRGHVPDGVAAQRVAGADAARDAEGALLLGLHAGEVIKEGEDFFGRNVIMAARVASQARGGEILASSVLKALVEGSDVSWGEQRTVELKGLSGDHEIWAVNWREGRGASRLGVK